MASRQCYTCRTQMRPCGSFVAIIAAATLVTLLACVALSGAPAGARSSVAGPPNLRGDVNCDLAFNALDILQVLDSQTGLPANTGCAQAAGVGCDTGGFISNAVIALLRELAGLTTPPGECLTPTPSPTPANTGTTSASPSPTSSGLTSSPTETPTLTPTATPTASSTGTVTPTPTATPTGTPTATPSPSPTPAPCDQMLWLNVERPVGRSEAIGLLTLPASPQPPCLPDGSTPAPTGTPGVNNFNLGHGILTDFGSSILPREGARLLALSSGVARDTNDPQFGGPDPGLNRGHTPLPDNVPAFRKSGWYVLSARGGRGRWHRSQGSAHAASRGNGIEFRLGLLYRGLSRLGVQSLHGHRGCHAWWRRHHDR